MLGAQKGEPSPELLVILNKFNPKIADNIQAFTHKTPFCYCSMPFLKMHSD